MLKRPAPMSRSTTTARPTRRERAAEEIAQLKAMVAERDAEIEDLRAARAKPVECAPRAVSRGAGTSVESTSRSFGAARAADARGELTRSRTVRSWRRRIRLCGRFSVSAYIGGACGMYRPCIGHRTGYSL